MSEIEKILFNGTTMIDADALKDLVVPEKAQEPTRQDDYCDGYADGYERAWLHLWELFTKNQNKGAP